MKRHLCQLKDLWFEVGRWWKIADEIAATLGRKCDTDQRHSEILEALLGNWSMSHNPAFVDHEWVANPDNNGFFDIIYQLQNPFEATPFFCNHGSLYISRLIAQTVDITGMSLQCVQVVLRVVTFVSLLSTPSWNTLALFGVWALSDTFLFTGRNAGGISLTTSKRHASLIIPRNMDTGSCECFFPTLVQG
jgi:hypothetical protein